MPILHRLIWVLLALLLPACSLFEPSKDSPYKALPEYAGWWSEVESCSGRYEDSSYLRYYVLDPGDRRAGHQQGHDIWIRTPYFTSRRVVEHEMLHVLIGDSHHEGPEWKTCGLYPLTNEQALEGVVVP